MSFPVPVKVCSAIAGVSILSIAVAVFAGPPEVEKSQSRPKVKKPAPVTKKEEKRTKVKRLVTVAEARQRAKLTHNIYATTLDAMHHHYFFHDRANVPARVMEDMFADIAQQENIKAKWIAVNAKAMSIDHEPEGEFEKQAAKEISAGKHEYERVEKGVYRRAVAISLMNNGCLGCHLGFSANKNKRDRFAGLVISIPVKQD
ncbi:c-type heme family protein [Gimesia fumaroli]|jgi:hypothetical protein|uniref:Tll0287-like domain-containing protein n=1 Tax=Gimesia fumaroli TaxID=2527976 RepID=A0A518IDU7_9PLAN|nr:DUF3365 domain-containing protein [Gimesia fumaroli]QDV51276.1 hypothetical protein Enr17x_33310 [Gimesia fumaroli]